MFQCIQLCHSQKIKMRSFVDVQNVMKRQNIKLTDDELVFGELLNKEIHKENNI